MNPDLWGGVVLVGLAVAAIVAATAPESSWLGRAIGSLSDTCRRDDEPWN